MGFHYALWMQQRPRHYQILVRETNASRHYEKIVCVQADQLTGEQLLAGTDSAVLFQSPLTMSVLFELAGACSPLDIYCVVKFDKHYHYPRYIEVYEGYSLHTTLTMIDGSNHAQCPE
jgi:hypothetical protein